VTLHTFADDTQLYLHCHRDDMATSALRLEHCLSEVSHWMSSNRRKLNADQLSCCRLDLGIVVLYWMTAAFVYSSE